MSAFELPVVCL